MPALSVTSGTVSDCLAVASWRHDVTSTLLPFVCSCCLERGELGLLWTASHLTLCLKIATPPLELKLYELSAAQCRLQLQGLVFDLWARLDSAHSKLAGNNTNPIVQPCVM